MITKENEQDLSKIAVDSAFAVHKYFGPGLLESAYEACLVHELAKRGLLTERQKTCPILYDGLEIENGYRLDIVVEGALILELKCVEKILPVHQAQIMTYLRLSGIKTGLIINFNTPLIKDEIKRISV
jgi:GxxExxY protein